MVEFSNLSIDTRLINATKTMGFEHMTQIQEKIIPIAVQKKDVIGQAQTGTGKTVAFGIPMIQNIDFDDESVQAIVLAPTRELALQVAEEINRLLKFYKKSCVAVYGGEEIVKQIKRLKSRPNIIVATPGRLMDHMRRKTIRMDNVKMVVLDEADEMLSMGFVEDIETILDKISTDRQTMLFSATMPDRIKKISEKFMVNPEHIIIKGKALAVDAIEQNYMVMQEKEKFDALCNLLDIYNPELCIIFGRTKRRVDELISGLKLRNYSAEGIHGDMKQEKRQRVLNKFKKGEIKILVATDVAARGLDISGVTHVINFDLPQEIESYVHRIGRTGRAGNTGVSFTFVHPKEVDFLQEIQAQTRSKMQKLKNPTMSDAKDARYKGASEKLVESIDDKRQMEIEKIATRLLETYDPKDLLCAALKLITGDDNRASVTLTKEGPVRVKKRVNKNNSKDRRYKRSFQGGKSERPRDDKKKNSNRRYRNFKKKNSQNKEN